MIKEIKYTGYSANPSDYDCSDGDLAMSLGLVNEDGALKPILPPAEVMSLSDGEVVKYIHETSSICHYIILNSSGDLKWRTLSSVTQTLLRTFSNDIYEINAIGNTLIALADDGMHYFLWKGDSDGYLYLGTEIPECPLSFGLQGEMVRGDEFDISFSSISEGSIWSEFSDSNKTTITDQILAKVNLFIADNSTNIGQFIYPFLLRYAYRLYDESLTKHSAPILMIASSDLAPQVFWDHISGKNSYTSASIRIVCMCHTLDYAVVDNGQLTKLLNWSDIINSVDIFVSAPIYTYDQNGECTKFTKVDDSDCYCVCKHTNQAASTDTYPLRYQMNTFSKLYAFTYNPTTMVYPTGRLMIPSRSVDDVKSDIKSCSQFYFLESISLDQLSTERTEITIEEEYLQSLVSREVMTDDYDSHDKLIPQYSFSYNSSLNIANLAKVLFNGHNASSLFNHSDGYVKNWADVDPTFADNTYNTCVYFFIKQDGRDIVVRGDYGSFGYKAPFLFLYYPNTNAYKAVVATVNYFTTYYEVQLEKHDFLNGAFYFGGWDDLSATTSSIPAISSDSERTIEMVNKIYTSEVNNPFYFPVLKINTVGTGNIVGISSAAKALSQGQFGSFPLYAFTTEGIWALEVSDTGTYSAKQTITRDVCINNDSITQIDSAVLFATDRGIMLISGSETQCISDILNSEDIFTIADLPKSDSLITIYNSKADNSEQITLNDITLLPFIEFIGACQMIYDYVHQRIIVYNPNVSYAYVYSMKSKMWGMMQSNISSGVNSYPEALAMTSEHTLVDFSDSDSDGVTGLVVTRPFKLDDPNVFKTIDTIIQRGYFEKDHVSQVLYGSNDLFNWLPIWSSSDKYMRGFRGSPFKAFRLVVFCDFGKGESLQGCSIQYYPRMQNKLR